MADAEPLELRRSTRFLNDWGEILRARLGQLGVKISATASVQEVSFAYWNAERRLITATPRTVVVADTFQCPPALQNGLAVLRAKFERGENVRVHLSTAVSDASDPNFNDRLLNDWGIHHFHLGDVTAGHPTGRSDDVLFARIVASTVYFIAVLPHLNRTTTPSTTPWAERDLIETVHRNWPETVAEFIPEGFAADDDEPTSTEMIRAFRGKGARKPDKRKTGFLYLPQMDDGTVYLPPGGGYSASGLSTEVLTTSNWYCNRVVDLANYVDANVEKILAAIRKTGLTPGSPPEFKLVIEDGNACVDEQASGCRVVLGPIGP